MAIAEIPGFGLGDPERQSAIARAAQQWGQAAIGDANAYSPERFYVKATDFRGHGERLSFKIPPDLNVQIHQMVSSAEWPDYTMPADVARDALVHLLAMRREQVSNVNMRESLDRLVRQLSFEEFVKKMQSEVAFWERMHEEAREALTALQRVGAWGQVWEYLRRAEEIADACPEPYRTSTLELIEEWRGKVPAEWRD